ncbi:peptidase M15 [uncultured Mediterranean phage]|nr:peptidase M15 [uncultured Mediterranean phage]
MIHFKEEEFNCCGKPCFDKMDKHFVEMLDKARSYTTQAFVITSSWRSEEHNRNVGGSASSSHLTGLAVDISAPTSSAKYEIIKALLLAGFTRLGCGANFVHCDADYNKPQNVIWTY